MLDGLKKAFSNILDSFKSKEVNIVKRTLAKVIKIKLNEDEIEKISDKLFFELLDADVPYEIAEEIKSELKQSLVNQEFTDKYSDEIKEILRKILEERLIEGHLSIDHTPYIIMLIGPNGYGKTSTVAKLSNLLKKTYNIGIIGADTFRAAAREQLKKLAEAANVDYFTSEDKKPIYVIKKGLMHFKDKDVILIDSAGRQEMNYNLMRELQAIFNNLNIDLSLFVLESTAGNAAYDQLQQYKKFVPVQGIILTKLDLDTKGGSVLAASQHNIPIYFITKGQSLKDIETFNKKTFIEKIL